MCLYPRIIENKRYLPNAKNHGCPPVPIDNRVKAVAIGCGKCIECRKQKANEWRCRLSYEIEKGEAVRFVTMTFSDEALNLFKKNEPNEVAKKAIELWRKRFYKKYKKACKHWLIIELGKNSSERMHLHGFVIGPWKKEQIEATWQYGYVEVGEYCNMHSINYCVKYISKIDEKHPEFMTKVFCSKGIGSGYQNTFTAKNLNCYEKEDTREKYRLPNGRKVNLPIYWRNKLFSEDQREKMWIERLDKQERYVCGERIDVSSEEGVRLYYNAVMYNRKRTEAMGYSKNPWSKKIYEKSRKYLENQK